MNGSKKAKISSSYVSIPEEETVQKQILTFKSAREYLNVSSSTLYKFVWSKRIPYFKPNGGKIYFLKADLENWITRKRIGTYDSVELS